LGQRDGIEELAEPELDLTVVDGHSLAMVASGVCRADAYYRGPYDEGAVFFTLQIHPLHGQQLTSPIALINIMSTVISQFPVDHEIMARSFLSQQGITITENGKEIVAKSATGNDVIVSFDDLGRISGMNTAAVPEPQPAAKKPWWRLGK
jgi:hypothetical protein